jgi:hypothetical protein
VSSIADFGGSPPHLQLVFSAEPPSPVLAGVEFPVEAVYLNSSGSWDIGNFGWISYDVLAPDGTYAGHYQAQYPTSGILISVTGSGAGYTIRATGSDAYGPLTAISTPFTVQSSVTPVLAASWGTSGIAGLSTAADGVRLLPPGRSTDAPWLGINRLQVYLDYGAPLASSDVWLVSAAGINYGPVTVDGTGTTYTLTLAQPINAADRITISIGNDLIAPFTRRLDVLPGDFNDDGVVNSQDLVGIRNEIILYAGALPTIFGDINGDGIVDLNDYTAARNHLGTRLPSV